MADPGELLAKLSATTGQSFADEPARLKALNDAQKLVRRLETPVEAAKRMMWIDPATNISLKVCSDLKVFQELASGPKSTDELANTTGAEPGLLRRFLRQLAAASCLEEKDVDQWAATDLSQALANGLSCTSDFLFDLALPAYGAVPLTLKDNRWREVDDSKNAAWQKGHRTELPFFDWLAAHPDVSVAFNDTMRATLSGRIEWFKVYPVQERLLSRFDSSKSDVLLVDVGGGTGNEIKEFSRAFPDHKGDLVLQDLASVVSKADPGSDVKVQGHSFFDPQPIKGATAYFMGSILHDWPDAESRQILTHLRDALKPGYSRIILRDPILPPKGADLLSTSMDLIMMAFFASKERTRKDWDELAASTGLKVASIWQYPGSPRGLIELVLQDDPT